MLQTMKELQESLRETGVALAARAISGVFGLVKAVVQRFEDVLGLVTSTYDRPGLNGRKGFLEVNRMIEAQGESGASESEDVEVTEKPMASGSRTARAADQKKGKGSTRSDRSRRSGRDRVTKSAQLSRVLKLLVEGEAEWMSASEISAAARESGSPILPGNVRKVVRLHGDGLVQTRPRADSRRGSLEYRITASGRRHLEHSQT